MTQLMLLKFNLHFDFSGLAWALANLVQGTVGVLTGFISGIIALVNRKGSYRITYERALSALYGAIIPSVGAVVGFLTLYAFEHDRGMKQILDGVALFALASGVIGMGIFIVSRNRRFKKPTKPGVRRW